jgi:hypothetical protein
LVVGSHAGLAAGTLRIKSKFLAPRNTFVGLVVARWMAAMRVGLSEMQPKMAEGAALFRPTILGY